MRRYLLAFGAASMVVGMATVVPGGTAGADDGGRPFILHLSGANEFNNQGVPINPHGNNDRGTGVLRVNHGQQEVCFEFGAITLTAGEALPNNAHIHRAAAGVAGGVVVPLFNPATAPTSYPTESTCVSVEDRDLLKEIIQHPERFYVNLHNVQHPGGVMRDQLRKTREP